MVLSETEKSSAATEKSAAQQQAPTPVPGRPDAKDTPPVAPAENNNNNNNNNNNSSSNTPAVGSANEEELRPEHLYKHPLQNTWTLWYLENDRTKSWEDMQNEITSFDTVEDFWSLYNHIKPPSEIKLTSDYSLFKKGIRPMWEDAANKQGGCWTITVPKGSKSDLDNLWLDVLLCLIGESFEHSEEVCGAVVNIRKINRISVWTAHGTNEAAALEIGSKLRESLRLGHSVLQYHLHKDTMVKTGSNVKATYTV